MSIALIEVLVAGIVSRLGNVIHCQISEPPQGVYLGQSGIFAGLWGRRSVTNSELIYLVWNNLIGFLYYGGEVISTIKVKRNGL